MFVTVQLNAENAGIAWGQGSADKASGAWRETGDVFFPSLAIRRTSLPRLHEDMIFKHLYKKLAS